MKNFLFPLLGHGPGDRSTCRVYVAFHAPVAETRTKVEALVKGYSSLFQFISNWGQGMLQLTPAVSKITNWFHSIDSYDKAFRSNVRLDVTEWYHWDERIDFSNKELYDSFNFDWEPLRPLDRQRLLLNFGVECLLKDIHSILPIHWAFYWQGKITRDTSWSRWSESQLFAIVEEWVHLTDLSGKSSPFQHQFLSDFFSAYLNPDFLVRLQSAYKEKLFDLFFNACGRNPDSHDMKWLLRLNGGDEIFILSKLSREEIRSIIHGYLVMKKIVKGVARPAAYEPGERAMRWLQEAFEDEFSLLMKPAR